ncbi:MAG: hypothetical protein ABR541_08440 [Candidatus Dormibacteria bacterium]
MTPSALGVPTRAAAAALAATTVATSPDGGIYRNPDHVEVLAIARRPAAKVADALGRAAAWRPLQRLGPFTYVALSIRDDGLVGSDPQLNDLQIASDFAPAGSATGPLRAFYHPTYPLAALSAATLNDDCSVHLDPGATGMVILVYPPVTPVNGRVVWGRFDGFALSLPGDAGAVGAATGPLRALPCHPPEAPPP